MLDDLVLGAAGTTANDGGVAVTLEGESVLADSSPPDVVDGAGALAVDTLDLVGTDDGVLEGSAVLEEEDGVLVATLSLASALDATAVGLHATIEGALDGLSGLIGDGALGGGDGEGGALLDGTEVVGGGLGAGGGDDGRGREGSEDSGELHFECGGWFKKTRRVGSSLEVLTTNE